MRLALGTVQFGLAYGIAGAAAPVADSEVRRILDLAFEAGVDMVDTAEVYGGVDGRLPELLRDRFSVVTKVAPLGGESAAWRPRLGASLRRAHELFGERLTGVLLHDANDLHGENGSAIAADMEVGAHRYGFRWGFSGYCPQEAQTLAETTLATLVQLPASAWDRRLLDAVPLRNQTGAAIGVHVRSVFLQGLLLLSEREANLRVPGAASALAAWHRYCAQVGQSPLKAALGVVRGFAGVERVVVGVDSTAHLQDILMAWSECSVLDAPELRVSDEALIDPRRWPRGPQ
jgi:aryl-alcohol dehydrogenase-like predicted oxidoreductase